MPATIEVRGLAKRYGDRHAVRDVSLRVDAGECVAVLGPNGAGKTTTVEILEGYRTRDAGEVLVCGVDPVRADRAWRDRIGIVLQSSRPSDESTVRELVAEFAGYFRRPRDIDEVIEAVGLTPQAGQRAKRLSGGQQRRLDVALGIVGSPEVLFLDEPTTGFDPDARRQFWALIADLRRQGTTILLTTHYLEEAEALADRVTVVADGRTVADAAPSRLGGRDQAPATVAWTEDGIRRSTATASPTAVVAELAMRFGGEVPDLVVARPTLEDVYLELIGASR